MRGIPHQLSPTETESLNDQRLGHTPSCPSQGFALVFPARGDDRGVAVEFGSGTGVKIQRCYCRECVWDREAIQGIRQVLRRREEKECLLGNRR